VIAVVVSKIIFDKLINTTAISHPHLPPFDREQLNVVSVEGQNGEIVENDAMSTSLFHTLTIAVGKRYS